MARYLLLFFTLLFVGSTAFAQTSLSGQVEEDGSIEPTFNAYVFLMKGSTQIGATATDFDGNYRFSNIDPGTYDVKVTYIGYPDQVTADVKVLAGKDNFLDFTLSNKGVDLQVVVIRAFKAPLIDRDNTSQGKILTGDDIKNLPSRNVKALAASAAGASSADEGDDVAIRGSRADATAYYVDGIRVQGTSLVTDADIDQLQIITGGIGAQYGDVSGGVISITTKGPSSKYSGGIEAETSKFLDPFNSNIIGVNFSGPILKNSKDESVIGFRLSGRYTYVEDDDPSAVSIYRIKEDKLKEIEANPVINIGEDAFVAADFLTDDDVDALKIQPFEERSRYDLNAKIDARFSEAIDISIGAFYSDTKNLFTPDEASDTRANWRLLNAHNNPFDNTSSLRGNFRFRHRLGGGIDEVAEGEEGKKGALIRNVSYTLQAGYENNLNNRADSRHGDNYFDYGYVGKLESEWVPFYRVLVDPDTQEESLLHADYTQVLRSYTPGTQNPVLANYNNLLGVQTGEAINSSIGAYIIQNTGDDGNVIDRTFFNVGNGEISDLYRDSWGYHTNVGTVYNLVRKRDDKIYTFSANASFDLVPGGSEKGTHNIQLGITYEQRVNRRYEINPRNLWDIARQKANENIQGIPFNGDIALSDSVGFQMVILPGQDMPMPVAVANYEVLVSETEDELFFRKIRESLGVPMNSYVNIDGLDPSQLSLDMFAAKELNDENLLNYYGYDYLGNPYDGAYNDFFTATDDEGIRTFPVAPARPIYTAAFIQDKFKYKDVIFRVGVRVDRYDANTKVLKDKYSLYEMMGADEFHGIEGGEQPGNIGDDFKVYTEGEGSNVQAYRDGDDWYKPNGAPVNDPSLIFSGGLVTPRYKDARAGLGYIKKPDFDPSVSFEDYEVQVNVMPRLAFSFPISEEANFFAHYDVLVQRPPTNSIASPRDYFYFTDEVSSTKNNPNLRPDRTVDYEVGFQQKLTEASALKVSAYYKELRDMITFRTISPVPDITSYTTFDNADFGTVKGFSFQYDLRRTGNITLLANYTLQFADGTGSDAESSRGLTSRGVIRTLSPLSYDERHRFNLSVDYRYKSGNQYTGPEVFGLPIFANTGLNVQMVAVSGRPYTANESPIDLDGELIEGAINGARKPWNSTINLRLDKTITLSKNFHFNVYLRVSNLLNTKNIIDVYSATGSPDNDGFITSINGINQIADLASSKREVNSFLASHQWRVLNPNYFSLPRRMFIGARFSF